MTAEPTTAQPTSAENAPIVSLALLRQKAEEYAGKGLVAHYEPDLGATFWIKPMSGFDMERAVKLSEDNPDQMGQWMAIVAVQKPKITLNEWQYINRLSPSVKGRLIQAIREASGMEDDALDKAKFDLLLTDTDNSTGTDSPPS